MQRDLLTHTASEAHCLLPSATDDTDPSFDGSPFSFPWSRDPLRHTRLDDEDPTAAAFQLPVAFTCGNERSQTDGDHSGGSPTAALSTHTDASPMCGAASTASSDEAGDTPGISGVAAIVWTSSAVAPDRTISADPTQPLSTILGAGSFGTVALVCDESSNRLVARKTVYTDTPALASAAATEVAFCVRSNEHPAVWQHVVRVFSATHDPEARVTTLDMEPMLGGTAASWPAFVGAPTSATWSKRVADLRRVAAACAAALRVLHDDMRVLHRDVKPTNVLMDGTPDNVTVKLADLGSAALLADGCDSATDQAGSTLYMSPERARGEAHTGAGDVWSLGVTVLQLALGGDHPLVDDAMRARTSDPFWLLAEATRFTAEPSECAAATEAAVDSALRLLAQAVNDDPSVATLATFVRACIQPGPADRPSASALLAHSFIGEQ